MRSARTASTAGVGDDQPPDRLAKTTGAATLNGSMELIPGTRSVLAPTWGAPSSSTVPEGRFAEAGNRSPQPRTLIPELHDEVEALKHFFTSEDPATDITVDREGSTPTLENQSRWVRIHSSIKHDASQ